MIKEITFVFINLKLYDKSTLLDMRMKTKISKNDRSYMYKVVKLRKKNSGQQVLAKWLEALLAYAFKSD